MAVMVRSEDVLVVSSHNCYVEVRSYFTLGHITTELNVKGGKNSN